MTGLIIVSMDLDPAYRKANVHTLPALTSPMVFNFCLGSNAKEISTTDKNDLLVDYVQVRRQGGCCELKALVFCSSNFANTGTHANVELKIVETQRIIENGQCSMCPNAGCCAHIVTLVFWLLHKSSEQKPTALVEYWGHELETLVQPAPGKLLQICDMVPKDEIRLEAELDTQEGYGPTFLESVLDELAICGRTSALFRQCVETEDEFESIFIHHVFLKALEFNIVDVPSLVMHMGLQAQAGHFNKLSEITKNQYKSQLWLEVQYMRIRCSMIHLIATRKTPEDDEKIFQMLFCKGRDKNLDERIQQKQHKRFILKQTEKLENKKYTECGLLLHESYPFVCGAPDGITDDHLVEIKSPKTDEDFEKYLESGESIAPKYMAQIQIQMFLANIKKALYCVLSPTFETSGALHYVWVQADPEFVNSLMTMAEDFWGKYVFPRLVNIYPQIT
ncbi:uncharacterized protein [Drosophila tropicalis]|uniref:uncharacterized protein isoform X1 n=1 Tax=Drosophila tropicalis TaxID=46794 RepID=UPI0035ABAA56